MADDQTSKRRSAKGDGKKHRPDAAELQQLAQAVEAEPENLKLRARYARLLGRAGRFDEALDCWYHIEEAAPEDPLPAQMIAQLVIARCRWRLKHPELLLHRDAQKKKKRRAAAQRAPRSPFYRLPKSKQPPKRKEIELTEWQKLEKQVEETPGDVEACLQVVQHYLHDGNDYYAERLLHRSLSATGGDPRLMEQLEDIQLERAQRKVELAQRRAEMEKSPGAKEALEEARRRHQQLEVEVFTKRCRRHPQDKSLKFELALRLSQAGQYQTALECFQETIEEPGYAAAAHLEIGQCLQRLKKFPEALQHYRLAAEQASQPEQLECKKLALYRAGVLAAGIKLVEPAKKYFSDLLTIDATYKDAASKLAELD